MKLKEYHRLTYPAAQVKVEVKAEVTRNLGSLYLYLYLEPLSFVLFLSSRFKVRGSRLLFELQFLGARSYEVRKF